MSNKSTNNMILHSWRRSLIDDGNTDPFARIAIVLLFGSATAKSLMTSAEQAGIGSKDLLSLVRGQFDAITLNGDPATSIVVPVLLALSSITGFITLRNLYPRARHKIPAERTLGFLGKTAARAIQNRVLRLFNKKELN